MLATDKGLATLPVSVMVIGISFGTLPIGWLERNYGRRLALPTGSVVEFSPASCPAPPC